MKFKAVIENESVSSQHQLKLLHVLQALQRLERAAERRPNVEKRGGAAAPPSIYLKLTPETFAFCHRAGADEGSQTWSHFQVNKLFQEYRLESKRGNRIDLEAPIPNLLHVFQSCAHSDRTTMRLANGRDGRPTLGFEFCIAGNAADHRVELEVPVRVIPEPEADLICEPALPEPEYQIELPTNLVRVKTLLEKMRHVGASHVSVEASQDRDSPSGAAPTAEPPASTAPSAPIRASLRFAAEAELVTIVSTFPSLSLILEGKNESPPESPVKLHLSLRRLSEVVAAFQMVSAQAHIACLLENRALVMYALLPQGLGSMISYTPAVT